jgi:hypothetical protein
MITIFGGKIGVFLKKQWRDQTFAKINNKRQFFVELIFKILTSVPAPHTESEYQLLYL